MGWYTSDTIVRFCIGHNHPIDTILEDPNMIYTLNQMETEHSKDKMKYTDTAQQYGWDVQFLNRGLLMR